MLKGIDVSGSNGIIDFTKVKKDNNFCLLYTSPSPRDCS